MTLTYSAALSRIEVLDTYIDSVENIAEYKYLFAKKLIEAGNYSEALSQIEVLDTYKDSAENIVEYKYLLAVALMEAGNYYDAVDVFKKVNGYSDSAEQILYCEAATLENPEVGDYVFFGAYEQDNDASNGKESIEWLVLDVQDDKALFISKYGLDCKQYNEKDEDVTWETCTLRAWLNGEFINEAFSEQERAVIPMVEISGATLEENATMDQVFLLSTEEIEKYLGSEGLERYNVTDYAVANGVKNFASGYAWWQRSYFGERKQCIVYAGVTEGYLCNDTDVGVSVRPALWIDLNALE